LRDKSIPFIACDSDNENSTLKRFYPDAEFINLAQPRSLDEMFRALERTDLAVVDCRAASTDVFLRYFAAIDIASVLRVLDARLTLLMPVNHEADSLDQVQRVVEVMADHARFIIIRNQVHAESFTLYDQSQVRVRLLKKLEAKEITMPRMEEWLVEGLNRLNLTITDAAKHESFYLLDRQRLVTWQHRLYEQIESAANLLLPNRPTAHVSTAK
jgi:hypothetical protein